MRLIDADELVSKIDELSEGAGFYKPIYEGFSKAVKNQPTIDAVPVVHGRWIGSYDFCCSACGVYQNFYTGRTNYCPSCGARMDLKGEQQ